LSGETAPKPPGYTVGITYNLKKDATGPIDVEAEYDSFDTVHAISKALQAYGLNVELFNANSNIVDQLTKTRPDIVFNIAEGRGGRGREAQVPALLNYFDIPYTGSDETTLCIALDKTLTKTLLATIGIKTPAFQLFKTGKETLNPDIRFPAIVKLNAEGSSKGIRGVTVAEDKGSLYDIINQRIAEYHQPVLVEEFIVGREFTVGIVGNSSDLHVFRPMEIIINGNGVNSHYNIYSYDVKTNFQKYVQYSCPANISSELEDTIRVTAMEIYNILECRDFSRIDFILADDGTLYFIEINPLPGLAAGYSDLPMLAQFNGVSYNDLVLMILNSGLERYKMIKVV